MKRIWSGREAASAQLSLPDQEKRSCRCLTRHIHAIRGRSLWLRGPSDTSLLSVMTAQTWRSATSLPEYDFWAAPFLPNSTLSLEDHCCWGNHCDRGPVFRRPWDMLVSGETAVDEARRTPPRG